VHENKWADVPTRLTFVVAAGSAGLGLLQLNLQRRQLAEQ
jgi:hypothetical protein